jgi:release factor glutamine methyltransferase
MTLKALQHYFHEQLDSIYGQNEVSSFFRLLIEHKLNIKPVELVLAPDQTISKTIQKQFDEVIKRLKTEEPIQYIIGETEFIGLPFKVNKHTLIPRPETEELVQWIIEESNYKTQFPNRDSYWVQQQTTNNKQLTILDIGTGSGCIAVSLAKSLPDAKVYAIDISKNALYVAKENAILNNVEVNFFQANILNQKNCNLGFGNLVFDLIVSNPPYVRELEKASIKNNVLRHEPHLALFVQNEDPLQFYKAICGFAVHNLKPKGRLFFEINQYLDTEMTQLLRAYKFESIALRKDLFGNSRMLKAIKP